MAGVRDLAEFRRDLRRAEPELEREMTRQLRAIGMDAAMVARGLTPRKSGRLAAAWRPTVTYRLGVAITNPQVYAGQHEYGSQVWLRRGLPIRDGDGTARSSAPSNLPTRWVHLPGGRIQMEARYLIPRTAPGKKAAITVVDRSNERIQDAMTRAAARVL